VVAPRTVGSDFAVAEALHNALVRRGMRVWWDQACLRPGEPWADGFTRGLVQSAVYVPVISRDAIAHRSNPRQSFVTLNEVHPHCLLLTFIRSFT
jgi:hypothetical protein